MLCFVDFVDGDPHTNHFYIGFWVICGIFGFLTLEKVFSEENEDDNSSKKKEKEDKVLITELQFTMFLHEVRHNHVDYKPVEFSMSKHSVRAVKLAITRDQNFIQMGVMASCGCLLFNENYFLFGLALCRLLSRPCSSFWMKEAACQVVSASDSLCSGPGFECRFDHYLDLL